MRSIACLVLFLGVATGGSSAPRDRQKYDGGVRFVTDAELPQGPCLYLLGMMTAPDFFVGLERRETSQGTEFRRGSRVITQFPDQVIVRIRIREFPCRVRVKRDEGSAPPMATLETMSSLRFAASWKRGMQMRPVGNLTQRTFFVEKDESLLFIGMPTMPARNVWNYEFVVPSHDVPLTDHLILTIYTPDGWRLARVSARL